MSGNIHAEDWIWTLISHHHKINSEWVERCFLSVLLHTTSDPELMVLLHQHTNHWDYRCVSPCQALDQRPYCKTWNLEITTGKQKIIQKCTINDFLNMAIEPKLTVELGSGGNTPLIPALRRPQSQADLWGLGQTDLQTEFQYSQDLKR